MTTLNRIALPAINAFFITSALLYLMYSLIYFEEPRLQARKVFDNLNWAQVPEDTPLKQLIAKPIRPIEPEVVPDLPEDKPIVIAGPIKGETLDPYKVVGNNGKIFALADSQLVLIFSSPPVYPASAVSRGIQGFVVVGFSVNGAGGVFDPYILESEPAKVFDRSALRAVLKFKYKAKMVNGKNVSIDGQRYLFTYELDG